MVNLEYTVEHRPRLFVAAGLVFVGCCCIFEIDPTFWNEEAS